jgi:hypothetical protein
MSQQLEKPNPPAHADNHVPLMSKIEPNPPSTVAKPNAKAAITSRHASAVDITEVFTTAASGTLIETRAARSADSSKL